MMTITDEIFACLKKGDDHTLCTLLGVTDENGQIGLHANVIGQDGVTVYSQIVNHPKIALFYKFEILRTLLNRTGHNKPQLGSQDARMCLIKAVINLNDPSILDLIFQKQIDEKPLIDINEANQHHRTALDLATTLSLFKPEIELSVRMIKQMDGFHYGTLPYAINTLDIDMIEKLLTDEIYETDEGKSVLDMVTFYSIDEYPAIPLFLSVNARQFSKAKFINFLINNLSNCEHPGEVLNYIIKHYDKTPYDLLHILQVQRFSSSELEAIYTTILPSLSYQEIISYLSVLPTHYHFMFSGALSSFSVLGVIHLLDILRPFDENKTYQELLQSNNREYERLRLPSAIDNNIRLTVNLYDLLKKSLQKRKYINARDHLDHYAICSVIVQKAAIFGLRRNRDGLKDDIDILATNNPDIVTLLLSNFTISNETISSALQRTSCVSEEVFLAILKSHNIITEIDILLIIIQRAVQENYLLVFEELFKNSKYEYIYNCASIIVAAAKGAKQIYSIALTQIVKRGHWQAFEEFLPSLIEEHVRTDAIIDYAELNISIRYKFLLYLQLRLNQVDEMLDKLTYLYKLFLQELHLPYELINLFTLLKKNRDTIIRAELLDNSILTMLKAFISDRLKEPHPDVIELIEVHGLQPIQMELEKVRQLTLRLKGNVAPLNSNEQYQLAAVKATASLLVNRLTPTSLSSAPAATYFSPAPGATINTTSASLSHRNRFLS